MTDVFGTNEDGVTTPKTEVEAALNSVVDLWAEKLVAITREDGTPKYESVEAALDALKASQDHIARIERDNAELTTKANEATTLKETLERLKGNTMNEEKPNQVTPVNGGLSDEAAAVELVKKVLKGEQETNAAINNVKLVQDKLIAKYGKEKAQEVIVAKAKELGTDPQTLKQLSSTSPDLVLALFGGGDKPSNSPNTSTVNSNGFVPKSDTVGSPDKSLLSGSHATDRNRQEYLRKIKEEVYRKQGITS